MKYQKGHVHIVTLEMRKKIRDSKLGEKNPNWKGGKYAYKRIGKKIKCERCKSQRFLLVHHKDRNRENNSLENLECLCKSCHEKEHKKIFNIKHMVNYKSKKLVKCSQCSIEFLRIVSQIKTNNFCSWKCYKKWKTTRNDSNA